MATVERTHRAEPELIATLRTARRDIVLERPDGVDQWSIEKGPFSHYRRTLEFSAGPSIGATPDSVSGSTPGTVTERIEFKLAIPLWWPYLILLFRKALVSTDRRPRKRWWWPMEVVGADTARLIGTVGTIGTLAGYMGVLIGQTITFAAADFGVDDSAQADALASTRIGVLLSMVLLGRADRIGRRPLTIGFAVAAVIFTSLGALAPNMATLAGTQMIGRGLTTGLLTLVTLAATEEAPASARAIAISFATLTTGFGAALVLWVLPVADLYPGGWRLTYIVPVFFLPLVWWLGRNLPETRRFTVASRHRSPGEINWFRFALIASAAFASGIYLSPASQLRNEFLRDELGYAATDISLFQLMVSIPATAAVPIGGHLADRLGRRGVGATALGVAAVASALSYQTSGWRLWALASIAVSASAAAVPALRGYQTELFPTRARGRVGGYIDAIAVSGSALGLVVVGRLATRWDNLGDAIGSMVFAPLLVVVVILALFPETAQRELEDFNPGDVPLDSTDGGASPGEVAPSDMSGQDPSARNEPVGRPLQGLQPRADETDDVAVE
ncbi:MAG: MFS transporter [Acidimicrobiia bacterium]|nr:MFS transporter [Acidimicrobiia bacterium]